MSPIFIYAAELWQIILIKGLSTPSWLHQLQLLGAVHASPSPSLPGASVEAGAVRPLSLLLCRHRRGKEQPLHGHGAERSQLGAGGAWIRHQCGWVRQGEVHGFDSQLSALILSDGFLRKPSILPGPNPSSARSRLFSRPPCICKPA